MGLQSQQPPIIHRDLIPDNILLNFNGRALIGGMRTYRTYNSLGSINKVRSNLKYIGTPEWMSPDIINSKFNPNAIQLIVKSLNYLLWASYHFFVMIPLNLESRKA